ncbi:hypothetical protein J2Z52_001065 [Enterococcus rivorum]|nr:hypothetical protein [Enterococcus rivorum]
MYDLGIYLWIFFLSMIVVTIAIQGVYINN